MASIAAATEKDSNQSRGAPLRRCKRSWSMAFHYGTFGAQKTAMPAGLPQMHRPVSPSVIHLLANPENRLRGSAPDSSTQTTAYSYRTRHCVLMADTYGTHKVG